jgi:hypothetical protein
VEVYVHAYVTYRTFFSTNGDLLGCGWFHWIPQYCLVVFSTWPSLVTYLLRSIRCASFFIHLVVLTGMLSSAFFAMCSTLRGMACIFYPLLPQWSLYFLMLTGGNLDDRQSTGEHAIIYSVFRLHWKSPLHSWDVVFFLFAVSTALGIHLSSNNLSKRHAARARRKEGLVILISLLQVTYTSYVLSNACLLLGMITWHGVIEHHIWLVIHGKVCVSETHVSKNKK